MHIRSIFFLFFFCCATVAGVNAQQTDWSLPTPREELPVSLIPYPREVVHKEGVVRVAGLKADETSKHLWESNASLGTELEDVCSWWGMNKLKDRKSVV